MSRGATEASSARPARATWSSPLTSPPSASLSDLAHGLLVHWNRGATLQDWASIVLCLYVIQFVEAESPEEDRLLEALWQASTRGPIADHDLALARTLTS